MVGEPKYPPEQIYWILDNVLKKTKNDVISQGFLDTFGKTLSPTQIRYIKNKYGKDPDFNAPLINKRLEYRGTLPLNFPYGSNAAASGSGQARSSTSIPLQTPSRPQLSPSHPASIPMPSIEQPLTPPSARRNDQPMISFMSPGPARYPSGGPLFPSPGQAHFTSPQLNFYSPIASNALPPRANVGSHSGLVDPCLEQYVLTSPIRGFPSSVDPATAPKRPLERVERTSSSSSPTPKRIRTEASASSESTTIAAAAAAKQPQGGSEVPQIGPQGQENTIPPLYQFLSDQLQFPGELPTAQEQSVHTVSLYDPNDPLFSYDSMSFWNQPSLAASPPVTFNTTLQSSTPVGTAQRTCMYSPQPPKSTPPILGRVPPHMVPLPDNNLPISTPLMSNSLAVSPEYQNAPRNRLVSTCAVDLQSVSPLYLMTTQMASENQTSQALEPLSVWGQRVSVDVNPEAGSPVKPAQKATSQDPQEGYTNSLAMNPDGIGEAVHGGSLVTENLDESISERNRTGPFGAEEFLLDLEPLLWVTTPTDGRSNDDS